MAASKADYEKILKRPLSDPEYASLITATRAPGVAAPDESRGVPATTVDDKTKPMFVEAKVAAKGAKPVAPAKGTGTISFLANTRQGEREIKENITSPADLDKYVAAGMIAPAEAAQYKAEKWPAPVPPQAGIVGKGKLVGDKISATPQAKDPKPLQTLVKTGPGVEPPSTDEHALLGMPKPATGPATPLFQAATAPPPAQPYASGMTNHPDEDSYDAIIANARKKWGL